MVCGQNRFSSRPAPEAKSKIGAAGSVWKGGQGSETGKRDREARQGSETGKRMAIWTKNRRSKADFAPAWRRRRGVVPRAGLIQPTPLAGEPLRPLGYFCVHHVIVKNGEGIGGESGIRTHGHLRAAGFQDRFLQPLGHLSVNRKLSVPES